MEKEMSKIHTHIGRSKFSIFAVVGFLALITYLLVTISTQLAETTVTTDADAARGNNMIIRKPVRRTNDVIIQPTISEGVGTSNAGTVSMNFAQCGQSCGSSLSGGEAGGTPKCAPGLVDYKFSSGAAYVCVCVPPGEDASYKCPVALPVTSCGSGCSNPYLNDGNPYATCPSGTSCTDVFGGYKVCAPSGGLTCNQLVTQPGTGPISGGGNRLPVQPTSSAMPQ